MQGFAAFDIDKCRNPETGEIHPWAMALVEKAASYTKITISGTGLRIIGRGDDNRGKIHCKEPLLSTIRRAASLLCGWRDARRQVRQARQRRRDGLRDRLGRCVSEYSTWRGYSVGRPLVASACPPDLLFRAKLLFFAAMVTVMPARRSQSLIPAD